MAVHCNRNSVARISLVRWVQIDFFVCESDPVVGVQWLVSQSDPVVGVQSHVHDLSWSIAYPGPLCRPVGVSSTSAFSRSFQFLNLICPRNPYRYSISPGGANKTVRLKDAMGRSGTLELVDLVLQRCVVVAVFCCCRVAILANALKS